MVVDPNVLVSAWISPHGFPRRILDAAEEGRFEMVVSEKLLQELSDVLSRPRLLKRGPVESARAHIRRAARVGARFDELDEPERVVSDDPKDDYLVALTRASGADYLVSGDPHLTRLAGKGIVAVLTARQFAGLIPPQGVPREP